jgi:low affinity Fe/Cu permease
MAQNSGAMESDCARGRHVTNDTSMTTDVDDSDQNQSDGLSARFSRLASRTAALAGNYRTFMVMLGIVLVWAISGPIFGFSTTWQLVINTGTTIITFLMVFLIQNTQNRDSLALHLKMDEIIRAIDAADDELIRAEDESEEELGELKERYREIMLAQRKLLRSAMTEHVEGMRSSPADAPTGQSVPVQG